MSSAKKILKNQNGILTLDFLFAAMLIFAFSSILFSFAITLSVAEIVQYISYSSARTYSLAHADEQTQRERAEQKFNQLATDQRLASLVTAGWFSIGQVQVGNFNEDFNGGGAAPTFVGAKVPFSAPILYKRLPLLGTTGTDPEGFTANLSSYLSRHPTFEECQDFASQRIQGISSLGYNVQQDTSVQMDNGC